MVTRDQPKIRPIECEGRKWMERNFIHNQCYQLVKSYLSFIIHGGRVITFTVPAGFIYDGASIPWFLWSFFRASPDGLWRGATLVHDWLYIQEGRVDEFTKLTRKEVDQIFLADMLRDGVPERLAKRMYRGVRTFGGLVRRF